MNSSVKNNGKLLIDATCAPADIRYPTDLSLLNEGREKLEEIIDVLHKPFKGQKKKCRTYRKRYGYYPESVNGDKTYRNRDNRDYCKSRNIRLSGPPLGRRKKDPDEARRDKELVRQDERDRIPVEGKFGNGKRRYGLDRIMAKRDITSESTTGAIILVMNLEKILRYFFCHFLFAVQADDFFRKL